jgi:hypothetical protein
MGDEQKRVSTLIGVITLQRMPTDRMTNFRGLPQRGLAAAIGEVHP